MSLQSKICPKGSLISNGCVIFGHKKSLQNILLGITGNDDIEILMNSNMIGFVNYLVTLTLTHKLNYIIDVQAYTYYI